MDEMTLPEANLHVAKHFELQNFVFDRVALYLGGSSSEKDSEVKDTGEGTVDGVKFHNGMPVVDDYNPFVNPGDAPIIDNPYPEGFAIEVEE